jgi:hypothetical protein
MYELGNFFVEWVEKEAKTWLGGFFLWLSNSLFSLQATVPLSIILFATFFCLLKKKITKKKAPCRSCSAWQEPAHLQQVSPSSKNYLLFLN